MNPVKLSDLLRNADLKVSTPSLKRTLWYYQCNNIDCNVDDCMHCSSNKKFEEDAYNEYGYFHFNTPDDNAANSYYENILSKHNWIVDVQNLKFRGLSVTELIKILPGGNIHFVTPDRKDVPNLMKELLNAFAINKFEETKTINTTKLCLENNVVNEKLYSVEAEYMRNRFRKFNIYFHMVGLTNDNFFKNGVYLNNGRNADDVYMLYYYYYLINKGTKATILSNDKHMVFDHVTHFSEQSDNYNNWAFENEFEAPKKEDKKYKPHYRNYDFTFWAHICHLDFNIIFNGNIKRNLACYIETIDRMVELRNEWVDNRFSAKKELRNLLGTNPEEFLNKRNTASVTMFPKILELINIINKHDPNCIEKLLVYCGDMDVDIPSLLRNNANVFEDFFENRKSHLLFNAIKKYEANSYDKTFKKYFERYVDF